MEGEEMRINCCRRKGHKRRHRVLHPNAKETLLAKRSKRNEECEEMYFVTN